METPVTVSCTHGCGTTVSVEPVRRHNDRPVSYDVGVMTALRAAGWQGSNSRLPAIRATCPGCVAAGRNRRRMANHPVDQRVRHAFDALRSFGFTAKRINYTNYTALGGGRRDPATTYVFDARSTRPESPDGGPLLPIPFVAIGPRATDAVRAFMSAGLFVNVTAKSSEWLGDYFRIEVTGLAD